MYSVVNVLSKRMGKKRLCLIGMVMLIAAYGFCAFLGQMPFGPWGQFGVFAVLAGVGMAIFGILPNAIAGDFARIDAVTSGQPKEGMFYAVQTFMSKLGQMVASVLVASLLLLGNSAANPLGIRLTGVVSAVVGVAALLLFLRYRDVSDAEIAAAEAAARKVDE